jgi:hypothetical protein
MTGWHDLARKEKKRKGKIEIELQYTCIHVLAEGKHDVRGTYFKATRGNRMVLYQDADTPQLPQVTKPKGQ